LRERPIFFAWGIRCDCVDAVTAGAVTTGLDVAAGSVADMAGVLSDASGVASGVPGVSVPSGFSGGVLVVAGVFVLSDVAGAGGANNFDFSTGLAGDVLVVSDVSVVTGVFALSDLSGVAWTVGATGSNNVDSSG
jgi:hypothetical protein